jgi:hypothetical protein
MHYVDWSIVLNNRPLKGAGFGRRLLLSLPGLLPIGAAPAPLEFRRTFFAGTYFNPTVTASSEMLEYLVAPLAGASPAEIARGGDINALSRATKDLLARDGRLQSALNFQLEDDRGNPVAIYLARAQHDVYTFRPSPSQRPLVETVVCIALSLDVFTEQAAWSSARRFETLFSKMLAFEYRLETNAPLDRSALTRMYQDAYREALSRLVGLVASQVRGERTLATAAFRISDFRFPAQLSPKQSGLLADGLTAAGIPADTAALDGERRLLRLELMHMLNQAIVNELDVRHVRDIVMLPPESPWANGRVLYLLKTRKWAPSDIALTSTTADAGVTGYDIIGAELSDADLLNTASSGAESRVYGLRLGARIMRTPPGGTPYQVPSGIIDPVRKTALGTAGQPYIEVASATRSSRREVVLDAFRAASADLAKSAVDLMTTTSREINR